ncbi:MAG: Hsp33 family molecular chaperone HslO [Paenibacillaceae bacterium]
MNNQDVIVRGMAMDGKVRVFAALSTTIVEELRARHDTWPTATAALGRAVTAGAMMGSMLKGQEKLTIQIRGDGPLGQIVVDANADGEVRGYVTEPHIQLPLNDKGKLDVAGAVGREGLLYVTKDLGMKEPYRGTSPIVSGELAEDFTYYFSLSEQTPSAVALGVLVNPDYSVRAAGGFILQLLPGLKESEITFIEQKLAALVPVTTLIEQGAGPEDILHQLFDAVHIYERSPIKFRCTCSQDRVVKTLISLGKDEMDALIVELGRAEVVCHFCNEKYILEKAELEQLRAKHFH